MLNFASGFTVGSCLLLIWHMLKKPRHLLKSPPPYYPWVKNSLTLHHGEYALGESSETSTTFPSNYTNLIARIVMGKERDVRC